MTTTRRWMLGSCVLVAMAATAQGADFFLEPVGASGSYTIVGNQIILDGSGQTVTLELRVDAWDPVPDVGICSDLTICSISAQDCVFGACLGSDGLLNTYQARIDGSGYAGTLSPVLLPPNELIDTTNPEFVFFGLTTIPAVDTSTINWAYGALVLFANDSVPYGGVDKYAGTLVVDVPTGTVGTFSIGFIDDLNESFLSDSQAVTIVPLNLSGAIISVACQNNLDCDDGNACTTDICQLDNTCTNDPNYDEATFCCDPATGTLTAIDDGNDCTDDICNPDGTVDHPFLAAGSLCGDPSNSQCDNPDTCDGGGTCLTNLEPAGTACGNPAESECDHADTCDGAGTCLTNIEPSGTACGDPSNTDCTDPDTCDGVGACLPHNVPNGVGCDDLLFCNVGETCTDGVCGGGGPRDCDDGLPCTDDSCNEGAAACDNVLIGGFCLIDGSCYGEGELDPANDCEACDTATATDAWTLLIAGTACDDGNPCTTDDVCDGAGVCEGTVDPNCNDTCVDAVEVFDGVNTGNNSSSSPIDDGEASCQVDSNNDVWFRYTAACNGVVHFTTTGSQFRSPGDAPDCDLTDTCNNDTVLSIYDACPAAGGIELACDDDGGPGLLSALEIFLTSGQEYLIRVAGFEDAVGDIVLNVEPVNDCVIDGTCYGEDEINPANECEACRPDISPLAWSPRLSGSACGDPTDTVCDGPDACDGAGHCEPNYKIDGTVCPDDANDCTEDYCVAGACTHPPLPSGTLCGDPTDNECDNPDTCDGASFCQPNYESVGVACGDQSTDQCDNANICDGGGRCDDNYKPAGTPCDDADVCTGDDVCDGGGGCAGDAIAQAPVVVLPGPPLASSRVFEVTPMPAGSPGPVALLVTSPDWTCLSKYIDVDGSLTDTPVFQLIDDWGTVTVIDEAIVPSSFDAPSRYTVQAECGAFTSDPGTTTMGVWCDIDVSGAVTLIDITAIVHGFQGDFSVYPKVVLDIWPCTPNDDVNFHDIDRAVRAFQGETYAETGCPVPCP